VFNNPEGKLMRIFPVLICSLALACVAGAQEEQGKKKEEQEEACAR
jgi:hypothetical protein